MRRLKQITTFVPFIAGIFAFSIRGIAGEWQETFNEDKADLGPTGRNPYFILEPNYVLTLEGKDEGKNAQLIITVLDQTRKIDGVETRAVEERESKEGKPVEVSLNFFAISKKTGNVYYFGEETTKYKDGKPVAGKASDSWLSGVDGATYGMMMPAKPTVGLKFYQERDPKRAMDRAEIKSLSEKVEVPAGKFEKCLKVEETTPLEKGEKEYKLYAEGVGLLNDEGLKLVRYGFEKKSASAAPRKQSLSLSDKDLGEFVADITVRARESAANDGDAESAKRVAQDEAKAEVPIQSGPQAKKQVKPPAAEEPEQLARRESAVETVVANGEKADLEDHLVRGGVTVFDFYADWCGPCREIAPRLEQMAESNPSVYLRKINIKEWNTPIAEQYEIQSIPSVWVFDKTGKLILEKSHDFQSVQSAVRRALAG